MAVVSKGAAGEVLAARFLREKGYTVVASNFRCRVGEIDIIAEDKSYIVFVEVKMRANDAPILPREAVTVKKQRRILQTAMLYLRTHPTNKQPRFDVVEVWSNGEIPLRATQIDHLIGAYEAGDLHEAF